MKEITGTFNSAKIFTDDVEEKSLGQVKTLCDQPFSAGAKIRLMPDIHAGAGCTIGTTMTITDKICPNLVGVDIGCGMETIVFHADSPTSRTFDPEKLDKSIRKNIPSGFAIRKFPHKFADEVEWEEAWRQLNKNREFDVQSLIESLKSSGRESKIEIELQKIRAQVLTSIPRDLAYVSGSRAWGFASPDSDYDVRFVYVRHPAEYMRLDKTRDVIEHELNDVFDINGWDVQKLLRLLMKSNPTIFEWASSPIVYAERTEFARLRNLLPLYFSEKRSIFHYFSMMRNNLRSYFQSDSVALLLFVAAAKSSSVQLIFFCVFEIVALVGLVPLYSAAVRRMHDIGLMGFFGFIPIVGPILWLLPSKESSAYWTDRNLHPVLDVIGKIFLILVIIAKLLTTLSGES